MNNIKFEGLGLDLNINSVMVDINGVKIYWYAFIIEKTKKSKNALFCLLKKA